MHKDKTILLVDDDLEILKLLETISLRIGFKPVLASSGKEALKKFVKYLPGVAVVDYNLPDMTGDEVIVEIKKMRPIIQPIVITGYGEYEKAVKALQSGAVDYIKKPFKKENIENAVNSAYARFKQLKDTMEVYHVLAVTQNDDIREYLKSSFSKDNWDINFCDSYSDTYKYLSTNMTDIVLIDIDNAENEAFAFLENLQKISENIYPIVITTGAQESTAIKAIRAGASDYINGKEDLKDIDKILKKALKFLEINRTSNFKISEVKNRRQIAARITETNKINIDIFSAGAKKTCSFAKRLFDSIPVSIAVADNKKRIIYANKFFTKNANKMPEKIGQGFIDVLKATGINDVPLDILNREIENLISSGEDIETITLGKNEYLTLTTLKLSIIPEKAFNALLIIGVGC